MKLSGGSSINNSSQIANEIILSEDIKDLEIKNADIATNAAIALSKLATDPLARANHTGTQLAATISDFTAAVQAVPSSSWTLVKKTADETISSDATPTADGTLLFSLAANKKYAFRMRLFGATGANSDFQWEVTGPASPTRVMCRRAYSTTVAGTTAQVLLNLTSFTGFNGSIAETSAFGFEIMLDGIVQNGANAGTFTLTWAQANSFAENTTLYGGSFIEYVQID